MILESSPDPVTISVSLCPVTPSANGAFVPVSITWPETEQILAIPEEEYGTPKLFFISNFCLLKNISLSFG